MEMALHSLHMQFPKQYITAIDIPQKDLFDFHPLISRSNSGDVIEMQYPLVHKSNQIANSFVAGYIDYLGQKLDIPLKLQVNKPHLYLNEEEKKKYKELGKYWVAVCGGKSDYITKILPHGHLQDVVNHFIGKIQFVQPIKKEHIHYPLKNVKVISKLSTRDLLSLIYNSEGVVCPVTAHQHIAAAFDKPCICIGGGREPVSWVMQYKFQYYLHSVGTLSCCKDKGCWKSRVIKINDNQKHDNSLCEFPTFYDDQWVSKCLTQIKPIEIISLMERISTK
jgi:ADP-heptose:LPS heptosyltransferase